MRNGMIRSGETITTVLGVAVAARDRPAPRPLDRRDSILFFEISEAAPSPAAVVLMLRALASTGALCESLRHSIRTALRRRGRV